MPLSRRAGAFRTVLLASLFSFPLLNAAAPATDPIFPEDGSARLRQWFANPSLTADAVDYKRLKTLFRRYGVVLRDIGYDYEWIQDVALFTRGGKLLLQADMPDDEEVAAGLSTGVLNEEKGKVRLKRVSRAHAESRGIPVRQMRWTFVEGGEMVTGRFADGRTYALMEYDVLERTQRYHEHAVGRGVDADGAKSLIARDLGISPDDLFFLETSGTHLDLMLTALPDAVLLVQDSSKSLPVLDRILASPRPLAEKARLQRMRKLYAGKYSWAEDVPLLEKPRRKPRRHPIMPFDPEWEVEWLDEIEETLGARFKIVRAAGVFREIIDESDLSSDIEDLLTARVNFFNGFLGTDEEGRIFAITNKTHGLPSLESYWRGLLEKHGIPGDRVHFLGSYDDGAGIDCVGASSG